jgi:hypothetical protein
VGSEASEVRQRLEQKSLQTRHKISKIKCRNDNERGSNLWGCDGKLNTAVSAT